MAEYAHKRIRAEWGFAGEDDRDMDKMLQQSYRGGRYSFGYPACPRLEDQVPLLRLLGPSASACRSATSGSCTGTVDQRDRAASSSREVLLRLAPGG